MPLASAEAMATVVALQGVTPLAVAMANPQARGHAMVVASGVFAGGILGAVGVKLLPEASQTTGTEVALSVVGAVAGGYAAYWLARRSEAAANASRPSRGIASSARTRSR